MFDSLLFSYSRLFCLFVFQIVINVSAQADPLISLSDIAKEPTWLSLVHYERNGNGAWLSAIHSDDFFLAPSGKYDPLAELQASLAAFSLPASKAPDQHAQCRFPARLQFLKSKLKNPDAFRTDIRCPTFESWTRNGLVSSVSVVFATGFLGNPASYYGHTLLKFNFEGDAGQKRLMDVSVNYGAIIVGDVDPITYMVKGVFGGYDGGFSHIKFYFFNHNYGDVELRDMWEYKLNLPRDKVDLIVAHAWEVLGKRYNYYFFRRNCAYRMAEIIQIVDGIKLIPDNSPWFLPQTIIQTLAAANYQGRPVVGEVVFHPSRQATFYEKYFSLTQTENSLVQKLVKKQDDFDSLEFKSINIASKQAILDTMLDYYQFIGGSRAEAENDLKQSYAKTLSERYQLEPGVPVVTPRLSMPPHDGRPPSWVQANWENNSALGSALLINFRPAYYDALDADASHVKNAAMSMGETRIKIRQGSAIVSQLDFVHIESVNPGLTGLPGDRSTAWKLRFGSEPARLWCDDCLVARVQGDIGYGKLWPNNLFSSLYLGGAVQNKLAQQGNGYAKTSADFIWTYSDIFRMKLSYEYRIPDTGLQFGYGVSDAEARWQINRRSDFRMRYEKDNAQQGSIGLGWYW